MQAYIYLETLAFIFQTSSWISRFLDVTTKIIIWNKRNKMDTLLRNIVCSWLKKEKTPQVSYIFDAAGIMSVFHERIISEQHQGAKHKQQYLFDQKRAETLQRASCEARPRPRMRAQVDWSQGSGVPRSTFTTCHWGSGVKCPPHPGVISVVSPGH